MNGKDLEFIKREFDLTRDLIKEHHIILQSHMEKDEKFQKETVAQLSQATASMKYIKAALGGICMALVSAVIAYLFH